LDAGVAERMVRDPRRGKLERCGRDWRALLNGYRGKARGQEHGAKDLGCIWVAILIKSATLRLCGLY